MDSLPFSQACENNKGAILEAIAPRLAAVDEVLEIGSGTGQHACFFAQSLTGLAWQPTELEANRHVLLPRMQEYGGNNLLPAVSLDVCQRPWPLAIPQAIFTANTLHIMPFEAVESLFAYLGEASPAGALLMVYGPFNYQGRYTSESNAAFDEWLHTRDPRSAIRDFEKVDALAQSGGYALLDDKAMPANNRLLVWQRSV
ncbi:MAG: DUF938 domain-containing protein [Halioglobus sp.]